MTRVNVVEPKELCDQHLLAEWREISRIPGNLKKSLSRKSKPFSMDEIPGEYLLGPGHVKFFYDKILYLEKRHIQLTRELLSRGFNLSYQGSDVFRNVPGEFYNDWSPTAKDKGLNLTRIHDRMPAKPRYNRKEIK